MIGKNFGQIPVMVDFDAVNDSGSYYETLVSGNFLGASRFNPGTQKAKGVFFLQDKIKSIQGNFYNWNVPKHLLFRAGISFSDSSFNFPVFARPCPVNPRHGFVDSTLCNNAEELNQVSAATYAAESDAEILVTKPVDSYYNAIINGQVITFARGNDGATGGKGCNYFYISEDPLSEMLGLNNRKVIAEDEIPFYEFVFGDGISSNITNLVQVRSAPKTPRVKDFVPDTVEVKTILKAEGDLLDWESLLKTVDPKTTIVDHTNGSLSSHYAIHAIVNKVPIFTTYLPELGSVVPPTVEDVSITDLDKQKFLRSFSAGFSSTEYLIKNIKYNQQSIDQIMGGIIRVALSTLHNFSVVSLSKDYELLGMVLGLFCRSTFAVSFGETRYNRKRAAANLYYTSYYSKVPEGGRNVCYNHMMNLGVDEAQATMAKVYHIFDRMKWDSSYGGKKWASCTRSAVELFNACVSLDIQKVVELFNRVINENHNGGKYLNKVVSYSDFDEAAKSPSVYPLRHFHTIVDILTTAWDYSKTVNLNELASKFKPLSLDWQESAKGASFELKNIFIKASDSAYFSSITVRHELMDHSINLSSAVTNPYSSQCQCSTCNVSGKFKLYSIPFWIVLEDGTRVISKAKLSKMLEPLGIKELPE